MKKLTATCVFILLQCFSPVSAAEVANDDAIWLTISEFSAVNDKGFFTLVEGKEVRADWIEIHNASREPINLDGWYLTDDPENLTLWQFPNINIEARGNLVVWASGIQAEDHPENWPYADDLGYYHTNFKLDAEGDYLALVSPDEQVVHEYASVETPKGIRGFPPQSEGISFGICEGGESFLALQTPGETNVSVCMEQCEAPVFSRAGGTFVNSFVLELTCPTPDAEIFYSLDGAEVVRPGGGGREINWIKYIGPITVDRCLEVLAQAQEPSRLPSSIVNESYLALSSDVASFSSNLPIIVVDTGRKSVAGRLTLVKAAFIDTDESGRSHITSASDFVGRGGLRIRGSSSSGFAKKQYAFETWDLDEADRDVSIWGLPAASDWILYGPSQYDPAIINNALAYALSNQAGRYAVRTRFCEMYLNSNDTTVSASDYIGLYILMEKITRGSQRVSVEKLEPWDSTEPRVSGGYVLSIDRAGDGSFSTSRGTVFNYVYPKGEDISATQTAWIRGYFNELETALYGPDFRNPETGYARYIDVNSFIDHHLLNLLPLNVDAFRLSGYMFKGRGGKLELGPVWDFDRAMNSTDSRDDNPKTWENFLSYYWWPRFFEDPHFWVQFIDRWSELRGSVFSMQNMNATIDRMVEEIREAQVRNTQRWPQFSPRYGGFDGEIAALKDWLNTRALWIDSQFLQPPVFDQTSSPQGSDLVVTLSNPNDSGTIYYALDGADPWVFDSVNDSTPPTMLVLENSTKHVLVPSEPVPDAWKGADSFDDSAWEVVRSRGGFGGIGYEMETGFESIITLDLAKQMYFPSRGGRTSCYIRIPFIVSGDPGIHNDLTLQMRYDDGFIAYLNGVEVARAGFAGEAAWYSHADSEHNDTAAMALQDFNISQFSDQLIEGVNILAIHGLNISSASPDFLISAQLLARERLIPPDGQQEYYEYTGPLTLTRATQIKARVRQAQHAYSHWSGLAQGVFSVGPVAETLRVSELMYHPADTGNPEDPNAEYIELTNIGDQAIHLNGVRFTEGIDFLFPDVVLLPSEYVLIVKDRDAFAATYDTTYAVVIGAYTGSLSNKGERVELVDAIGEGIQTIQYSDKWYDLTDGQGFSLTMIDPADPLAVDASEKELWRPSADAGGSPGWDDRWY
ncbi:MAG: CotH kinase family protein [Phycisphaerae bacterium]|nr:CotH kinase family protein [Phycisphaerae bacterium]